MSRRVWAMLLVVFFGPFIISFASDPAVAQSDSTKVDTLNSAGKTLWNPLRQVLRITAPAQFEGELRGRVSAVSGDTLIIERYRDLESNYVRVPFSLITRCRQQNGTHRNILAGALIGAAVGCGVMSVLTLSDSDASEFGELVAEIIGIGTGSGALTGGIIGAFVRSDRWEDVPIKSVQLGVSSQNGLTAGIRLAVRF